MAFTGLTSAFGSFAGPVGTIFGGLLGGIFRGIGKPTPTITYVPALDADRIEVSYWLRENAAPGTACATFRQGLCNEFNPRAEPQGLVRLYNAMGPRTLWDRDDFLAAEERGVHPSRLPWSPYASRYSSAPSWHASLGVDFSTEWGLPVLYEVIDSIAGTIDRFLYSSVAPEGHPAFDAPTVIPPFTDLLQYAATVFQAPARMGSFPYTTEQALAEGWRQLPQPRVQNPITRDEMADVFASRDFSALRDYSDQKTRTWLDPRNTRDIQEHPPIVVGAAITGSLVPEGWIAPDSGWETGELGAVVAEGVSLRDFAVAVVRNRDYAAQGFADPEFQLASALWFIDNRPGLAAQYVEDALRWGEIASVPQSVATEIGGDFFARTGQVLPADELGGQVGQSLQQYGGGPSPVPQEAATVGALEPVVSAQIPYDPDPVITAELEDTEVPLAPPIETGGPPVGWFDSVLTALPQLAQTAVNLNQAFNPAMQRAPVYALPQGQAYVGGGPAASPITLQQASAEYLLSAQLAQDPTGRNTVPGLAPAVFTQASVQAVPDWVDPSFLDQAMNVLGGGAATQVGPGATPGTFFGVTAGGRRRTNSLVSVKDWNGQDRYWVGGTKLSARWIKNKILSDQRQKRRCPR